MKLKICGIRNQEMYDFCIKNQVDFMGFNFVRSSKRRVSMKTCLDVSNSKDKSKFVALFMDQPLEEIMEVWSKFPTGIIQLHGNESPKFCEDLRQRIPPAIKIWKAFRIDEKFSPKTLEQYIGIVDLFLFDGSVPGSGETIVASKKLERAIQYAEKIQMPYGIAGGINSENIEHFMKEYPNANLLDLASGVESNGEFDSAYAKGIVLCQSRLPRA